MPVVRSKLDLLDVIGALKAKGYGVNSDRTYQLQLLQPSKTERRKWDNAPRWEKLRGLSRDEVETVLFNCETVEEASLTVEKLSRGEVLSAVEETRPQNNGVGGLSAEQLAGIIESRVQRAVDQREEQTRAEMAAMRAEMGAVLDQLKETLKSAKPAKGQKRTKKVVKQAEARTDAEIDEIVADMAIPPEPNFDD